MPLSPHFPAPARSRLRRIGWAPGVIVLVAYIIGKMFYLSQSGLPQPADLGLIALAPFFIRRQYLTATMGSVRPYIAFLGLVIVVNLVWLSISQNMDFLQTIAFYGFNAIVFLFVLSVVGKHRSSIERSLTIGLFIAVAIQIFVVMSHVGEAARSSGTFQNPNQLGYWALCVLGIFFLARQARAGLLELIFTSGALYIAFVSLSRSTILAIALLAVVHFARHAPRRTMAVLVAGLLAGTVVMLVPSPAQRSLEHRFQQMEAIEKLERRFARASEKSQLEVRGYDRITDNPTLVAVGAGEGYHERFSSIDRELHSTIGTVLFSYGLLGMVAFLIFLGSLTGYTKILPYLYLAPFVFYGLAHQGLRFSFFWVFCALLAASSRGLLSSSFRLNLPFRRGPSIPARGAAAWRRPGYASASASASASAPDLVRRRSPR